MIERKTEKDELYYRLVSLWIVCEAFAGGILHAAKIPFTGMMVSSLSVTCISLIAFFVPSRSAILKATVIVALFKLMLSPHSPPTAYIALFFQGYMGQLLFMNRKHFDAAAIILCLLSLVESSVQRILVLIILYGNDFWNAVDQYLVKLTGNEETDYTRLIAIGYIIIHAIVGILTGIFVVRLIRTIQAWSLSHPEFIITGSIGTDVAVSTKKKKARYLFIVLYLLLAAFFIHSLINPANSFLPTGKIAVIFLRSVLILLTWYLILSPLIMKLIRTRIENSSRKLKLPMNDMINLIAETRYIFTKSWELSYRKRGFRKLNLFIKILIMNILIKPERAN